MTEFVKVVTIDGLKGVSNGYYTWRTLAREHFAYVSILRGIGKLSDLPLDVPQGKDDLLVVVLVLLHLIGSQSILLSLRVVDNAHYDCRVER